MENRGLIDVAGRSFGYILPESEKFAGMHIESLNLDGIPSGNYILKMQSNAGSLSVKIVKE